MAEELRYGIIGCGMMGREHIRNLDLLAGCRVTAISEPDAEQRKLSAAAAPRAAVFADTAPVLEASDVDVILIASPNHTHVSILRDVFTARPRPVLVEKPVVTTLDDCVTLAQMARAWPAPIWVAMEYRYMPPVAELLSASRKGEAGTPRMLSIREHRFPFLEKVGDWNRFNRNTGGTLVEKCCHFFDLMRLILDDEPVRVSASGAADVNHLDERYDGAVPDILDNAYVVVDFRSGKRAMLELCMFAEGAWFQETITLTGDKGRLECAIPGPARFWPGKEERAAHLEFSPREPKAPVRREIEVDPELLGAGDHHGSTYYQHVRFRDAVLNGASVEVGLHDGITAVVMGIAAQRAIEERRVVELEELTTLIV